MLTVTLKGLWARKRRLAGTVIAVVLGVAFLAGALSLGDTLSANFTRLFTTASAGTDAVVRSTTTVSTGENARRPLIPAALAGAITGIPGVADAQPSISGYGQLLGSNGVPVGGLGPPRTAGNWISDPRLTPYRLVAGRAPRAIDEVVINRGAATAGKLHLGDVATVQTPAPVRVRIVGLATFGSADGLGASTFTAFTLAGAELYLTHRPGEVSSIQAAAAPGVSQDELVARIARVLPAGIEAVTGTTIAQQNISDLNSSFLNALRDFLDIFAVIALFVATFTIASTFSILVAQRTREIALLRAVGATRRQVLFSVVVEALALGAVASVLGFAAGLGFAGLLKGLFDSFGLALPAGGLVVKASSVLVSVLVGIAVTVAAGLIPALRASRVAPLEAMREAAADPASPSPRRGIVGAVLAVAGLAVTLAGTAASGSGALSIVGLGALLLAIGVIVLGPVVARAVTGAVGLPVARWRGMPGSLARGNAMRNPRRSAAAATALMVGVTVVALFTVFAASLTAAVTNDVTDSFTGDIAVTAGSLGGGGSGGGISPEVTSAVAGVQGVRLATGLTSGQARVAGQAENVTVVDPAQIGQVLNLHSSAGSVSALGADQLGVSKRQADSKHWQLGTTVPVVLPDGTASQLIVGAIYTSRDIVGDYVMPIALWTPHAIQSVDSAIFVKLAPGTSVAVAEAAVSRVTAAYGKLTVADHAAYVKSASSGVGLLAGLVNVLLVLAIIIAVLGIANTISLSVYERTREIGLLRAVGETRRQLRSMIRLESLIVSLFGTVGGLALGAFLGWALVEGASKSSGIGTFSAPVTELVVVLVLGGIAGVIAAIRPARRAARLPVLAAIAAE